MDGKNNQILDPKLKEAYDRVMGASVPPPTPKPAAPPPPADMLPHDAPQMAQTPGATPHEDAPASHVAQHPHVAFSASYVAPGMKHEQKTSISGTLLIVLGGIFLLVYTLFWMKWFGMSIPFLG